SVRSGNWAGALEATEKGLLFRPGGDDRDYLLRALALRSQGQADAASQAADTARRWARSNRGYDQPLVDQLSAAAEALPGGSVPGPRIPPQPIQNLGTNPR